MLQQKQKGELDGGLLKKKKSFKLKNLVLLLGLLIELLAVITGSDLFKSAR